MAHSKVGVEIQKTSAISLDGKEEAQESHRGPVVSSTNSRSIKQLITDQIAERVWRKESVSVAIEVMTQDLSKIGVRLNCIVLDRGEGKESDELLQFLNLLKDDIIKIKNQTRFQLAIKTGVHWTACDVLIEDLSPTIFILDAAFVVESLKHIDLAFNKVFPKTKTYMYFPDEIKSEDSNEYKARRIQFDEESCALFTIDHLASLVEIDLFSELKASGIKGTKMNPNYFRINPTNCPTELAVIFKATQSFAVLESLPANLKNKTITPGFGYSLFQYPVAEQKINAMGMSKRSNITIEVFRNRVVDKVVNFLEQYVDLEIIDILDKHKPSIFFRTVGNDEKYITTKVPSRAMEYFIGRMLQELHEKYKNKSGIEIYCSSLVGADIRMLMSMELELATIENIDNMPSIIEDYKEKLTDLAYYILKKYVDNLKNESPIAIIDLLNEYKMRLNEKFYNYSMFVPTKGLSAKTPRSDTPELDNSHSSCVIQ